MEIRDVFFADFSQPSFSMPPESLNPNLWNVLQRRPHPLMVCLSQESIHGDQIEFEESSRQIREFDIINRFYASESSQASGEGSRRRQVASRSAPSHSSEGGDESFGPVFPLFPCVDGMLQSSFVIEMMAAWKSGLPRTPDLVVSVCA